MDESSDPPSDAEPTEEVTARVDVDGVSVRKTANRYGDSAVAVYVTIRSSRQVDCTVRLADAIPEPLRENEVEFHPRYDPGNWSRADGTIVYTATVAPDTDRTSAYGITVDDPGQVQLFAAEPAVEVSPVTVPEVNPGEEAGDLDAFDFGPDGDSRGDDAPARSGPSSEVMMSPPTGDTVSAGESGRASPTAAGRASDPADPVEALVATIRRRDLTDAERRALGEVLDTEQQGPDDTALESLRADLGAVEDELAAVSRRTADVEVLERRVDSLAADLETLEAAIDRETRWRSQLQDSIRSDPDPE